MTVFGVACDLILRLQFLCIVPAQLTAQVSKLVLPQWLRNAPETETVQSSVILIFRIHQMLYE